MKSPAPPTDRIFRFGQFELSEREGVLRKNGVRIKVQEQPFRVLVELLVNAGKLVTREELQQKLWPADTFVDFDVGLNTAIRKIRQALGDDADHPRYIETTAKRGYTFLGLVEEIVSAPASTDKDEEAASRVPVGNHAAGQPETVAGERAPASEKHSRWYFLAAALSGLLVLAIVAIDGRWHVTQTIRPAVERRVTANPAEAPIRAAVISPDGKYLAYADTTGLYLREIASGETSPVPLPKDFRASPSSWFPDSTHLLVTWRDRSEQKASIWKISILGGDPQMLLDDAEDGVVSPDGSLIAYFHRSPAALYGLRGNAILHVVGELWLASSDGQNPRKFVVPASDSPQAVGTEVTAVSWAPDSRRVAYIERHKVVAHSRSGDLSWLLTRDLTSGQSQLILRDHRIDPEDLCWTRDGRLLYVLRGNTKNPGGDSGVEAIRIDLETGKASGNPEPVSSGLGWIGGLSVTADGKRLFLWRGNELPQVFVGEFDKGNDHLTSPRRLTLDEGSNQPTAWLPDSRSVLFLSNRNGAWKLYKQGIDRTIGDVALETPNIQAALPRLTADGSEILFAEVGGTEDPAAPVHLMRIPLDGGIPKPVLQDIEIDNFSCSRTPATVCVYSKVISRTTILIAFDMQKGKGGEIARFDGWPSWALSPDGSQLAVLTDGHQGRIEFISLKTGGKRDVVVKDWPVMRAVNWTADGRGLLITSYTTRGTSVVLDVDLEGNARVLLENSPNAQFYWAIPSPDGRYAAMDVVTGEENVWMVENF